MTDLYKIACATERDEMHTQNEVFQPVRRYEGLEAVGPCQARVI